MTPTFAERVWQNLDKLMLFVLFLICLGVAVWMQFSAKNMDESGFDWVRHNTDLVLAGLLGLMGGRAFQHLTTKPDTPADPVQDKPNG